MSDPNVPCSIYGCNLESTGQGVRISQPLCERHLAQDKDRVKQQVKSMHNELKPLKAQRDKLRIDQATLTAEIQEADELLDAAVQSLMKHKEAVINRLTARQGDTLENLREFSMLEVYESEVAAAESANDIRKLFEMVSRMEIQSSDLWEKWSRDEYMKDSASSDSNQRVVKDVSGGLRDLQLLIDRKMQKIMHCCESGNSPGNSNSLFEHFCSIKNLGGQPCWMDLCTNTLGFIADSSGRVVKAESENDNQPKLPSRCLYVLFENNSGSKTSSQPFCLIVLSVDGIVRLKCFCKLDWTLEFSGLHCDSQRQLLFISLSDSVIIADLSGAVCKKIDSDSLGFGLAKICGICGNSDKVFLFERQELKLLGVGKDDGLLHLNIDLQSQCKSTPFSYEGLSVLGSAVFVTDSLNKCAHKFCTISKQLIASYPTKRSRVAHFDLPNGIVAHSSGLVFISEHNKHIVRILDSDGAAVATIGSKGAVGRIAASIENPVSLSLIPGEPQLLAVSHKDCISLFKLLIP